MTNILDVTYHARQALSFIEAGDLENTARHFLLAHAIQQHNHGSDTIIIPFKALQVFLWRHGHQIIEDELVELLDRIEVWDLIREVGVDNEHKSDS